MILMWRNKKKKIWVQKRTGNWVSMVDTRGVQSQYPLESCYEEHTPIVQACILVTSIVIIYTYLYLHYTYTVHN